MFAVRRTALTVLLWKIHRALYRATGGRFGSSLGRLRVLLLATRGRRSGERREVALNYFEQEGTPVVVGSNAGDDRHPAWYLNLEAEPEAEIPLACSFRVSGGGVIAIVQTVEMIILLTVAPQYVEEAPVPDTM